MRNTLEKYPLRGTINEHFVAWKQGFLAGQQGNLSCRVNVNKAFLFETLMKVEEEAEDCRQQLRLEWLMSNIWEMTYCSGEKAERRAQGSVQK